MKYPCRTRQRGGPIGPDVFIVSPGPQLTDYVEPGVAAPLDEYLNKDGWIVSSSKPLVNIPNYPDESDLMAELKALPHTTTCDIEVLAKDNGIPKSANMILLGMAAKAIDILTPQQLLDAIARVFAAKGEKVVNDNIQAFDIGQKIAS